MLRAHHNDYGWWAETRTKPCKLDGNCATNLFIRKIIQSGSALFLYLLGTLESKLGPRGNYSNISLVLSCEFYYYFYQAYISESSGFVIKGILPKILRHFEVNWLTKLILTMFNFFGKNKDEKCWSNVIKMFSFY